jgi:hypothetical protein
LASCRRTSSACASVRWRVLLSCCSKSSSKCATSACRCAGQVSTRSSTALTSAFVIWRYYITLFDNRARVETLSTPTTHSQAPDRRPALRHLPDGNCSSGADRWTATKASPGVATGGAGESSRPKEWAWKPGKMARSPDRTVIRVGWNAGSTPQHAYGFPETPPSATVQAVPMSDDSSGEPAARSIQIVCFRDQLGAFPGPSSEKEGV